MLHAKNHALYLEHRLSLTHTPANAPAAQWWCRRHLEQDDASHAIMYKPLSEAMTFRHDMLKGIWRHIACLAGVTTSLEPLLRLLPRSQAAAIANKLESSGGDISLALLATLTWVDVSVVYLAAAKHVNAADHAEGGAASVGDQAKHVQYENTDPLGYAIVRCQQMLSVGLANLP